jgi:hypothetical protein
MRKWNLEFNDPYTLIIAADARLTNTDYADDQIWRLNMQGGEPRALAFETTYGLRARMMRIFPEFRASERAVTDPSQFRSAPVIQAFFANYLSISCQPLSGLAAHLEYWVPESSMAAGRISLANESTEQLEARLLLYAQLKPDTDGSVMTEQSAGGATILAGKTSEIEPILFLTGGAGVAAAPYPALEVRLDLVPGESKSYTWVHVGDHEVQAGFARARGLVDQSWDAAIAKVFQINSSILEVETGDQDWDLALAFAQKLAINSFVGPTRYLPNASIVSSRTPDQGYSIAGDGRDYDHRWEGQNALHTAFAARQIVHIAPELAKGLLRNFLSVQSPDGYIDQKPGLGGQRSNLPAAPVLASLALHLFNQTEDQGLIEEAYEGLTRHYESWFDKTRDRDGDGFPEWVHTMHAGNEDWPAFVRWRKWGQALDISKAETPDLAAYMQRENQALVQMAEVLGRDATGFHERQTKLEELVQIGWSERNAIFHAIDRDLHKPVRGQFLGRGRGEFVKEVGKEFDPPVRVLVRAIGKEDLSHAIQVFIHGKGRTKRDRVERLTETRFQWFQGLGSTTTDKTYSQIDRIEVRGLSEGFRTELRAADFRNMDISGLLPLWARIPYPEQAEILVEQSVLNPDRFWRSFGIPIGSASETAYKKGDAEGPALVGMVWNGMIGEGLVDYGYRDEAVTLLGKLIKASAESLRRDKGFAEYYHADRLEGLGEREHVTGAPPLSLFMHILGLRLISPRKIILRAHNPFPWPVKLRWRGVSIRWEEDQASVTFSDGGQTSVEGDGVHIVEQLD